ncbi:MAG: hypothetical protein NT118_00630 [Lentisphaerae bacterium]|nr:hypothetical protein [Lentisphaerota bacterium]
MAGNLLGMGLQLRLQDALWGLCNVRFVSLSVLWGFVLCPALAYLLTIVIPLPPPYAMGLILLGITPCAPFLPMMVSRARGDMGYAATFMLLTSVIMVAYMPFAVPAMVAGLSVSAWTIAKPLLYLVLIPLAAGMAILQASKPFASGLQPFVKKITGIATIIMIALCVIVYGKCLIGSLGCYAILAQAIFFSIVTAASYGLAFGLPQTQKSVLSLGLCTRNLGAALAPLFTAPGIDEQAIVMVVLGVPMQIIFALIAARFFARRIRTAVVQDEVTVQ